MKSQYVCAKMATLLDGILYVKIFNMLFVDCSNGHVVFIVNILQLANHIAM